MTHAVPIFWKKFPSVNQFQVCKICQFFNLYNQRRASSLFLQRKGIIENFDVIDFYNGLNVLINPQHWNIIGFPKDNFWNPIFPYNFCSSIVIRNSENYFGIQNSNIYLWICSLRVQNCFELIQTACSCSDEYVLTFPNSCSYVSLNNLASNKFMFQA